LKVSSFFNNTKAQPISKTNKSKQNIMPLKYMYLKGPLLAQEFYWMKNCCLCWNFG